MPPEKTTSERDNQDDRDQGTQERLLSAGCGGHGILEIVKHVILDVHGSNSLSVLFFGVSKVRRRPFAKTYLHRACQGEPLSVSGVIQGIS